MTTPLEYRLAYRLGLTPWEHAGRRAGAQLSRLLDREEAERNRPLGKALDVGCGRGAHTRELAARGWEATGIDAVHRAVDQAVVAAGDIPVRFIAGDVTDLAGTDLGTGYDFFLDIGCLHGLSDRHRDAAAAQLTTVATPTATLLTMAFAPGRRGPLPRGVDRASLAASFRDWEVVDQEPAEIPLPGPLNATPTFYRLRRR